MDFWEANAKKIEQDYGGFVDWKERFYICPECGEPVYDDDWSQFALSEELCPICGYYEED